MTGKLMTTKICISSIGEAHYHKDCIYGNIFFILTGSFFTFLKACRNEILSLQDSLQKMNQISIRLNSRFYDLRYEKLLKKEPRNMFENY